MAARYDNIYGVMIYIVLYRLLRCDCRALKQAGHSEKESERGTERGHPEQEQDSDQPLATEPSPE